MAVFRSACGWCGTVSWIFALCNGTLLPTMALVIGVVYRDSCPLEPRITLYMYVTSSLCIGCFVYSVTSACCLQRSHCACFNRCNENKCFYSLLLIEIAMNLTIFVWLVLGSVWIYSHHTLLRQEDPRCHSKYYLLSFVLVTVQWILFTLQHVITFVDNFFLRHRRREKEQRAKNGKYVSVKTEQNNTLNL